MAEDDYFEEEEGRSSTTLVMALLILMVAVAAGAFFAFFMESENDPVIIKADKEPIRVRPSDPGGLKFNNLDSPVMGLLDPLSNQDTGREVLTPPETAPELPPITVEEPALASAETQPEVEEQDPAADQPVSGQLVIKPLDDPQPQSLVPQQAGAAIQDPATPDTVPDAAPKPDATSVEIADQGEGEAVITDTAALNKAPIEETGEIDGPVRKVLLPQPRPKITPKVLPDGDAPSFVVQFAAFKNEKNATNTAAVLANKHSSRLNDITIGYMKRGKYWRVVTDPMPRVDASALCSLFRSVGQDCIVKLLESPQ